LGSSGEEPILALVKTGYVVAGTGVKVGSAVGTGLSADVFVGDAIVCGENGTGVEASGLNTSILNVQPESRKRIIMKQPVSFFISSLSGPHRFSDCHSQGGYIVKKTFSHLRQRQVHCKNEFSLL
jgi:hypothetical protein